MPREMQVPLPNRIRELRAQRGEKARHLAVMLDVGEVQVTRYELGHNEIPLSKAKTLADHFGVTIGYLLGYEDEPEPSEAAA